jgi:hypothetical protein
MGYMLRWETAERSTPRNLFYWFLHDEVREYRMQETCPTTASITFSPVRQSLTSCIFVWLTAAQRFPSDKEFASATADIAGKVLLNLRTPTRITNGARNVPSARDGRSSREGAPPATVS